MERVYTGVPFEPAIATEVGAQSVHPDNQRVTAEAFEEALRNGTTFLIEHRIRSVEGHYRWFLVRVEPYRDPGTGQLVRWFGSRWQSKVERGVGHAKVNATEGSAFRIFGRGPEVSRPLGRAEERWADTRSPRHNQAPCLRHVCRGAGRYKTVIGTRLKQSGMFWSVEGANAIIASASASSVPISKTTGLHGRKLRLKASVFFREAGVKNEVALDCPLLCRA